MGKQAREIKLLALQAGSEVRNSFEALRAIDACDYRNTSSADRPFEYAGPETHVVAVSGPACGAT